MIKLHYHGIRQHKRDPRDFPYHKVFGSVKAEELPTRDFIIGDIEPVLDQKNTDMCTSYTSCELAGDQDSAEYDINYQFAKTRLLMGDDGYGADIRTAMKVGVKFGFLPKAKAIYDFFKDGKKAIYPFNYGMEQDIEAEKNKRGSFFFIGDNPDLDIFDDIRSALWLNKDDRETISCGSRWYEEWNHCPTGIVPKGKTFITYHNFQLKGQKTINGVLYIVARLSSGKNEGDKGYLYFPREIVNKEFTEGLYSFKSMTKEKAQHYIENGITVRDGWLVKLLKPLFCFLKDLVEVVERARQ